jgi:protein-disulfide isomerase
MLLKHGLTIRTDLGKDLQVGKTAWGVSSTPTLFVNDERFDGTPSTPQLDDLITETKEAHLD